MKQQQFVETGYVPRPLQAELHRKLKRFNILVLHRRAGKTHFSVNEMIDQGLRLYTSRKVPRPRYSYIAPTYSQAKRVAWDLFKSLCSKIPGAIINENELRIDISLFNDPSDTLRFQLLGAENPDSIRGIYLDGVIIDEPANVHPALWGTIVRPTLLDRNGWAIFIGTPAGKNAFYDLYQEALKDPDWFTATYRASETGIIPAAELEAMRRQMGDDTFEQEMECNWSATNKGSYYGKQMGELLAHGKITRVPHDPALGVITAWDLGISDSTAIWFAQRCFKEVRIIDHMEVDGLGIPDIVRLLKEKDYNYTTHILPHDAAAREMGTGKTRQEVLRNLGIKADVLSRQKIDDGIQAVRNLLPLCWFDAENCARGITALREYKRDYDEKLQMFKDKPRHDQYSHSADAFRQLALGIDMERGLSEHRRQHRAITEYEDSGSHI